MSPKLYFEAARMNDSDGSCGTNLRPINQIRLSLSLTLKRFYLLLSFHFDGVGFFGGWEWGEGGEAKSFFQILLMSVYFCSFIFFMCCCLQQQQHAVSLSAYINLSLRIALSLIRLTRTSSLLLNIVWKLSVCLSYAHTHTHTHQRRHIVLSLSHISNTLSLSHFSYGDS